MGGRKEVRVLLIMFPLVLFIEGCAAVGLTLFGVGAGVTAGTGVSYTLDSIAYKTFTAPLEELQGATLKTLNRMDIEVKDIKVKEETTEAGKKAETGREIVALAGDRTIEIELDRLTSQTTRMRVNAKRGWFLKDRATATEIIIQTEQTLENEPTSTRQVIPTAASSASKNKK